MEDMRTEPDQDSLLPTRHSLLTRLKDWEDQDGWREFFDTYWRLIYSVARRAGLNEAESQDVVQETLVVVAKQMPSFRYDPARGSFKAWLHTVIRGRLSRHWRKAKQYPAPPVPAVAEDEPTAEELAAEAPPEFDAIWQSEWEQNLLDAAVRRVQAKVSARQFLLFSLAVFKGVPVATIRERYDASLAQVYLAKHRVGRLLKSELAKLRAEADG
jgi:RNA polymerase sigma factor (sigma-70 family)